LIALKDYNGNNLFDPQRKNRFHKKNISIPNDTLYELELFRDLAFKANRYKHLATKLLAYEGDMTTITNRPTVLKNKGQVIESLVTQYPEKILYKYGLNQLKQIH
jgi:hypothetical protein